jgi:hypothetical protein
MRIALFAAICFLPSLLTAAAYHPSSGSDRYFVVDGRDYREVDRAAFDARKPFCTSINERDYPGARLIMHHCES